MSVYHWDPVGGSGALLVRENGTDRGSYEILDLIPGAGISIGVVADAATGSNKATITNTLPAPATTPAVYDPSDWNLQAYTLPPSLWSGGSSAPVAGVRYYSKMKVTKAFTAAFIHYLAAAAASAEIANAWLGIMKIAAGTATLVGRTADLGITAAGADMKTAGGRKAGLTAESGQNMTFAVGDIIYVEMVIGTQGVTNVTIGRQSNASSMIDINQAASDGFWAGQKDTGQSTLATSVALNTMSGGLAQFWFGLS